MKGLLCKDFMLLKEQKLSLLLIFAIAVGMTTFSASPSFAIGYFSFIGGSFTLSTISYDEADNGNAFLFSLPISRKEYAREKYLLGLTLGGGCWLFSSVFAVLAGFLQGHDISDIFFTALFMFPFLLLLLSIMLPLHLKFGGEKGRIAIIIVMGILFFTILSVGKVLQAAQIQLSFPSSLAANGAIVLLAFLLAGLCVLLLSYQISAAIMKRKEF